MSLVVILSMLFVGFNYILGVCGLGLYLAFIMWTMLNKSTPHHGHTISSLEAGETASAHAGEKHHADDLDEDDGEEQPTWKGVAYLAVGGILIYSFSEPFISTVCTI